jgi:hypothetical protein
LFENCFTCEIFDKGIQKKKIYELLRMIKNSQQVCADYSSEKNLRIVRARYAGTVY